MEIPRSSSSLWDRLPHRQDITYVFGGVVFMVYAWAVQGFFYQFSSLRLYHNIADIFAVFSYLMAFALLESLLVLGVLIGAAFLLPSKWFKDGFAVKGFLAAAVAGIAMVQLQKYLYAQQMNGYQMPSSTTLFAALLAGFFLLIVLILFVQKVPSAHNIVLAFEERLQVFLYIFVPLGILGFIVVFVRNIQ